MVRETLTPLSDAELAELRKRYNIPQTAPRKAAILLIAEAIVQANITQADLAQRDRNLWFFFKLALRDPLFFRDLLGGVATVIASCVLIYFILRISHP